MKQIGFMILMLVTLTAKAQVHKCTNAAGNIVYSATACPSGYNPVTINLKTGSQSSREADSNALVLEQEMQLIELKKQAEKQQLIEKKQTQWRQHVLDESAKNQFLVTNNPQQFAALAIAPYLPDKLPELVKAYANRLPDIERFRRLAANKVLAEKLCQRIESDSLDARSGVNGLVFVIDCSSGQHLYFTEQQLN